MLYKKPDITSPEYRAYEEAKNEYSLAAKYLQRLIHTLPPKELRSQDETMAWLVFRERYSEISKRFFDAKRALALSFSAPSKPSGTGPITRAILSTPIADLLGEKSTRESKIEDMLNNPGLSAIVRAALLSPEERANSLALSDEIDFATQDGDKEPENAKELVDEGLGVKAFTNDPALEAPEEDTKDANE